jgi:DNA-binding PadR family transcriptional regulator
VLEAGVHLHSNGTEEFHGYLLAKQMREEEAARRLIAHGTLYKALDRLVTMGYLESRWEDPTVAAEENRPRRRFYKVTGAGSKALVLAREAPAVGRLVAGEEAAT